MGYPGKAVHFSPAETVNYPCFTSESSTADEHTKKKVK